jgi:hypothetical protein
MPSPESQSTNNIMIDSTKFSKTLNHAEIPEIEYFKQQISNLQNELNKKRGN